MAYVQKIAVFIDDLDRCQPDKAVALLESIKLILSQPGFVFVLAVDPQPIEGFLQKRYCSHFGCEEGDWGKFYMEKIIQLPIIIPNHRTRFADYVRNTVDSLAARNGGSNPAIDALKVVRDTVAKNGRILFVGTKRQAQKPIAEAAEKCAQYYMNHRWLGGTLTNWQTVSKSIQRLKQLDEVLGHGAEGLTKKERLGMEREQGKLQASLGGIREMGGVPDLLFVIDVGKEDLAILEAQKLGIPVVGIVDTNNSPKGVNYVIPGNDDAARAIGLYCDLVARAALDGMSAQMGAAGVDLGALEDAPVEEAVAEA